MNRREHQSDRNSVPPALADFATSLAEETNPEALYAIAEHAAQRLIGHRLFTIMAFHEDAMEVERLYSSNVRAYPPGGRKKKRDTEWGHHVLERGEPYIGRTADDIRASFNDHEIILGLGLESVLNMPVRLGGRTLGTVNLLHERDYYRGEHLVPARVLAALLAGPLEEVRK